MIVLDKISQGSCFIDVQWKVLNVIIQGPNLIDQMKGFFNQEMRVKKFDHIIYMITLNVSVNVTTYVQKK